MRKVLLIALPVGLALLVAWGVRWLTPGPAIDVAAALAPLVKGKADGPTVGLPEGRIVVTERTDPGSHPNVVHFHLKLGLLDACAVGVGETPEQRAASVAEHFVATAYPVFLSFAHRKSEANAIRFHGGEPWSVPGRTGYMGQALVRGEKGDGVPTGSALFSGISKLPDGVHLVKAVLIGEGGKWRRSIEIDGQDPVENELPFAGVAPAEFSLVTQFALVDGTDQQPDGAARDAALAGLKSRPAWLFPPGDCPPVPEAFVSPPFTSDVCTGGRLAGCVSGCRNGDALSCYSAAGSVERELGDIGLALHLAACRLGHASGCTNAAAGRQAVQGPNPCSSGIFEAVCEKAEDPWACVMFGATLKGNPMRARAVLAKACRLGEDDPACLAGKQALVQLEKSPPTRIEQSSNPPARPPPER